MGWIIRIIIWLATTAVMAIGTQVMLGISFWWGIGVVFITGWLPLGWLIHLVMFLGGLVYLNSVYQWVNL